MIKETTWVFFVVVAFAAGATLGLYQGGVTANNRWQSAVRQMPASCLSVLDQALRDEGPPQRGH